MGRRIGSRRKHQREAERAAEKRRREAHERFLAERTAHEAAERERYKAQLASLKEAEAPLVDSYRALGVNLTLLDVPPGYQTLYVVTSATLRRLLEANPSMNPIMPSA